MKLLQIVFFLLPHFLFSSEKINLGEDILFQKFLSELTSPWEIKFPKNQLVFRRRDPVLVLPSHKLNAPEIIESEESRIARFQKQGMRQNPMLVFNIRKKMNIFEQVKIENTNSEIELKIQQLRKKYKIDSIQEKRLSPKSEEIYTPKTKKEKLNLKKFIKERDKLNLKYSNEPSYLFDRYVLVFSEKKGINSEYTEVYPDSVTGEFLQIEKALYKYKKFRQE